MFGTILIRLLQVLGLVAVQVLVCNQIRLLGFATPMVGTLFFCYLPQNAERVGTMVWAFVLGLLIDVFSGTLGENAAALTLVALVQWPLLRAMMDKDAAEDAGSSFRTQGGAKHFFYMLLLASIHHVVFYALEVFSAFHLADTLLSMASSLALSLLLMCAADSLRDRK